MLIGTFPDAHKDAAYRYGLVAEGGEAPYTWSIIAGSLPPDLAIDPDSGPVGGTAERTFTIELLAPATVRAGERVFAPIQTIGNAPGEIVYEIEAGELPPGLVLDSPLREITGVVA